MAETEKQLVLRLIDEVVNGGDLDVSTSSSTPTSSATRPRRAAAAGRRRSSDDTQRSTTRSQGFASSHCDVLAEDGRVAIRARVSGRHVGEYNGLPPSGREWSVQQIHIVRVVDGKLIEHWASRDDLGALRQLGLLPSTRHTAVRSSSPHPPLA